MAARRNRGAAEPSTEDVSEAEGASTSEDSESEAETTSEQSEDDSESEGSNDSDDSESEETEAEEPKAPYRVGSKNALSTLAGLKGPNEGVELSDLSRDPEEAEARAEELCEKKKLVKN